MSSNNKENEKIKIKAKPLDLSSYTKSDEQKLISRWANQLINLIFTDNISTIGRPIFLLRHLNSSSRNTLAVNRCPNVLYVPDPFQADTIQSIFIQLKSPSVLTWGNILECLKSGSFTTILEQKDYDEIDLSSIESFFLVLLYFICYAHQDLDYQLEEPFAEILQLIMKKELKIMQTSSLSSGLWETVFKKRNLRFESYATGNSPKYCPSNVYFNEILDCIRLRSQNQSNFIKAINEKGDHSRVELEQLGRLLQCSFYTFLEFSLFSEYLTIENIKILSKYAKNLPTSWFTPDFLQTTLNLAKREKEKPVNESCLKEILEIYVWWMKKNSSFLSMTLATDIIEFVLEVASIPDLICQSTLIICSAADKLSAEYVLRLSNILAELLSNDKQLWKDSEKITTITPGLAHLMKLIPYPGVISTAMINSWSLSEENYKLLHIYHFILKEKLQEAGLIGVGVIKKKKRNSINNGWLFEIMKSCENKEKPVQSLYAMAGILKGFHPYTTDNFLKSNESSLVFDKMTKLFSQKILLLLDQLENIPDAKECVAYCFSECFNIIELIELDHKTFSKLFIDERLLKALFDNIINQLKLEDDFFDNMYKGSIAKDNSYMESFAKKLENPLFNSLGKQSKAFGVILWNHIDHLENLYNLERRSAGEKRVLNIYEGFTNFLKDLYNKWKDCKLNDENVKSLNDKPIRPQELILRYFRDFLFIYTMITKCLYLDPHPHTPTVYDEDDDPQKKRKIDFRTCMILNSLNAFSYLHFVTISFGEDGFDIWRDVIEEIISQIEQLKPDGLIEDVVSQFKVEDISINSSSMEKYRFIFFLYVSKRLISYLSLHFVHQFMYRPITQFLSIQITDSKNNTNNINYDLFNSSHKTCLSIFENPERFKKLILSIADDYSNLLIHDYPNNIDYQRLRQGYFSLIRGLSSSVSFNNSEALFTDNEEDDVMMYDEPVEEQKEDNPTLDNKINSEECDIVALRCLLKLTNKIYKYSELITSSSINTTDNNKNNSYKAQLITERGHFITILFDQIQCVSIPVMEILLEIIKQIVLNNCIIIDFNCQNIHAIHQKHKKNIDDKDKRTIEEEEEEEEDMVNEQQDDTDKENSILASSEKITLCEDLVPLNSQLWKSLYDTVSSARLDRRKAERCVLWYLSLHNTKKNNAKELNNDDEIKSKKSNTIDNSEDNESEDDQPSISKLKSKL
ncbi:hypothetical protein BCR32DRAFT_279793 [Anaeromyces robustus]|uniref:Uncharacterized protein n=1 Tax=Anaeromyces robustus TaxID=1754192 RepID=A0A1Y1X691_9FUNG|nr:hypothetical protein BCR32DRAFT_279793 [Anaeromyces robustus]|eukprot:ORX81319.1 hypothetical protein BCR32DRAFT_279793 [Anaeromyces robustus]